MGYDRYNRPENPPRDSDGRNSGYDYRAGRDRGGYGDDPGSRGQNGGSYTGEGRERISGNRDYYGGSQRDHGRDRSDYGTNRTSGERGFDHADRGFRGGNREDGRYPQDTPYRGSYAGDGDRLAEARHGDRHPDREHDDDRGFLARAGDEVRSWFGDEDAERRRERDQRYDEQMARYDDRSGDHAYRSWRDTQVSAFDRDYDEYRQENATKFQNEFSAFRTERQGQRDSLNRVCEHMEVLGSDGVHIGTVDKVRGDRIILTKNDSNAGGHHHSIPSRWVDAVDGKVTLRKTGEEAYKAWRDEDAGQATFGNQQGNRQYGHDRFGESQDHARPIGQTTTGQAQTTTGQAQTTTGQAQTTTGQAMRAGTSTTAGTGIAGSSGTGIAGSSGDGDGATNPNRRFDGTY